MKKTLTINLGGIVFHIDEDAYQFLSRYLENLERHFSRQEGFRDILNDIESRIAEILGDRLSETRQVVTVEDVNEVIAIMGNPVEFDREEPAGTNKDARGGRKGDKRFFRNPDEKVIAGVCSGIASYFHLDPVWIRLIFLVFILAGGSGILLYLVLWIVIPEALTTTDKLEMRGEKINILSIEKSIREEVSELGTRVGAIATESAATIKRAGSGSGAFFEGIRKGLLDALKYTGRVLVILTGIILILLGAGILIALLAYTLGWTGSIYSDYEFTVLSLPRMANLLVGCNMPVAYIQVILLMVLGIPLFMIFYNGLRMVFRFEKVRHLGFTMFNIWLVGLFLMAWLGLRIYNLYKFGEEKQIEIALEKPATDTLNVM
ncbi:MAG: PspC domain-containing protein, partial [Bacteroidota bacterium]